MRTSVARLGDAVQIQTSALNPITRPDHEFHLYSIPAFDGGLKPEKVNGSQIGSNKYKITSECVLVSKINPRIKRIWYIKDLEPRRAVCSTEFISLIPNNRVNVDLRFMAHFLLHADLQGLTATAAQAATKIPRAASQGRLF
jgi:type I restriction enzyme S subunit